MVVTPGEAELRRALAKYDSDVEKTAFHMGKHARQYPMLSPVDWDRELRLAAGDLLTAVKAHLPAVLAELDRLRAAIGEDIETATGFSGHATEALK